MQCGAMQVEQHRLSLVMHSPLIIWTWRQGILGRWLPTIGRQRLL